MAIRYIVTKAGRKVVDEDFGTKTEAQDTIIQMIVGAVHRGAHSTARSYLRLSVRKVRR